MLSCQAETQSRVNSLFHIRLAVVPEYPIVSGMSGNERAEHSARRSNTADTTDDRDTHKHKHKHNLFM